MAPKVGHRAPSFALYDADRNKRSLAEFLSNKTVLAFYPGAFTPVCTRQLCIMTEDLREYEDLGAKVVGISVDNPWVNKSFAEKYGLKIPLLCDFSRKVVKAYGVIKRDLGDLDGYDVAKRALFVLDKDGIVRWRWIRNDTSIMPNFAEIKEALKKV